MREPRATTAFFNGLGRRVAYFYVRHLMRSDVEWEADLLSGAKIVAANHPTTTDPFLMMSWPFEPVYILITEAAFKVPLIGRFLRLAGHIPVHANCGLEAYEAALHLLSEGRTVGIFPEGALSGDDGQLVRVRSGAVRLAITAGVPIVPAGIAPDWHFVTARRLQGFGVAETMRWFWLGAYEVSVGRPLAFEHAAHDREAVDRSTEVLMQEIERLRERSARRLLDAGWPLKARAGKSIGDPAESTSDRRPEPAKGGPRSDRGREIESGWRPMGEEPGGDLTVPEWGIARNRWRYRRPCGHASPAMP